MDFLKFHPRFSGNRDSGANLKKVLALVLAFACAFTMFAGAAFTDQADIKATDAVDMLVALGVVDGFEDGSFQPNGTVTRAQMAKMIYVLRTGKSDASAYNNDKTSFTDINGHWAAGYIKYCQSLGIIAGKSSTIFAPNASVTAQEAAKMLLVTLGYNAEKAGLTGPSWASRTNALADENGLLKDVNTAFTAACPRQYAAQLIYNAIDTPTVVWRDDAYTNETYTGVDNKTIGQKYMGLEAKDEGRLMSVKKEDGKDTFRIQVAGVGTLTKVEKDYSNLLGENVKVLYKDTDKVYGVFSTDDNTVVTALADDVDKINTTAGKLEIDSVSYKTAEANANNLSVRTTPDMSVFTSAATIKDLVAKYPYYSVKFVDYNDDDKLDYAVVTPFVPAQIDSISSSKVTVSAIDLNKAAPALTETSIDRDDADLYEGAAEDDYVAVVDGDYSVSGNTAFTKMVTVSGKVDSTRTSGTEFKTSGTWYTIEAKDVSVSLNDEYDFATVGKFAFAADATSSSVSASNILFVDDIAKKTSGVNQGVEATVYFADGTSKTVTLTKYNGDKIYDSAKDSKNSKLYDDDHYLTAFKVADAKGTMYKFTKKSDTEYEIKSLDKNKGSFDEYFTADTATSIKDGKVVTADHTWRMADEGVIFVKTQDETKVLTGKQVKAWSDLSTGINKVSALADKSSGYYYAKVGAINLGVKDIPGSSDSLYAYATSKVAEIDNDGTKYQFEAWTGKETVTLTTEDDDNLLTVSGSLRDKGFFVEYTQNGDLVDIKSVKTIADAVAISGFDADGINFRNVDSKAYSGDFDDDYVVIGVDTKKVEGVEGGKLKTADEVTKGSGKYYENAVYFLNNDSDKDVIAVFVDTNGKMYDADEKVQMTVAPTKVPSIAVTVTAPVTGATPAAKTDVKTTTDGVVIKDISWNGELKDGKFAPETEYTATITVGTKSDLYLINDDASATVAGSKSATYKDGVITVTFDKTAKAAD